MAEEKSRSRKTASSRAAAAPARRPTARPRAPRARRVTRRTGPLARGSAGPLRNRLHLCRPRGQSRSAPAHGGHGRNRCRRTVPGRRTRARRLPRPRCPARSAGPDADGRICATWPIALEVADRDVTDVTIDVLHPLRLTGRVIFESE